MRRMRRKWVAMCTTVALLFGLVVNGSAPLMAQESGGRSVAVFDLTGEGLSLYELAALSDGLRAQLHAVGQWDVIDPERIADALGRVGVVDPSACDDACAFRVGGMLGADRALVGRASRQGGTTFVRLRMLDVGRGILAREAEQKCRGDVERILKNDIPGLVSAIAKEKGGGRLKLWLGLGVGVASVAAYVITQGGGEETSPPTPLPEPPSRP